MTQSWTDARLEWRPGLEKTLVSGGKFLGVGGFQFLRILKRIFGRFSVQRLINREETRVMGWGYTQWRKLHDPNFKRF